MKHFFASFLFLIVGCVNVTSAQQYIDKVKFFKDTSLINATLTFNIKRLLAKKDKEGATFSATFNCRMGDSLTVNDHLSVEVRGHFRHSFCYLPPLKLIYKDNQAAAFYRLKSLKLVNTCMPDWPNDQNLLKEFMVYKIYNLITDKSFRVRLLNLSYKDSSGKKKTITKHAFLLEDIREVAKRNNCEERAGKKYATEATNRRQMTIAAIFEYMIGNTDWAVPANHNIKLIRAKGDSTSRPFVIPYDFDYSGLVNTSYAIPDERLRIENVRERVYRGFPRTMEELNEVLDIFKKQKANIYATINNFNLFSPATKSEMIDYLDEFFRAINDPAEVKDRFITNARTQ